MSIYWSVRMPGYNDILNPPREYKDAVMKALITGKDFPDFILVPSSKPPSDMLAKVFLQRDFADVDRVMKLQYERFGPIDKDLFWSAIGYIARHEHHTGGSDFIQLMKGARSDVIHIPGEDVFFAWKTAAEKYFNDAITYSRSIIAPGLTEYSPELLMKVFANVLDHTRLSKKGWRVEVHKRTNFISIAKSKKKILVGDIDTRLSQSRLVGLILHEVYIHALWSEHLIERNTDYEEGVGTLVEQLMLREFYPLRMYRFLAIAFAVGLDGKKRTMRQVFELLCDVRSALKPDESEEKRKLFVAKEVLRVYRNLPPSAAGIVYIRDKNYMENNGKIWSTLSKEELNAERFIAIVAPWEVRS